MTTARVAIFSVSTAAPSAPPPSGEQLREHPPSDVVPAMEDLPVPRTSFLGRERELQELASLVAGGDRVITLVGLAGVGKTRLALRFAQLRRGDFDDGGIAFCDLTEARDAGSALRLVAEGTGTSSACVAGRGDDVAAVGRALAARGRCLVILDNCEQVAGAVALALREWSSLARDACFLVTSRERLRLDGERCYELAPLTVAEDESDVAESDAVKLFLDRAQLVRARFAPRRGDELRIIGEIVRRLDGLPLAIELAAARTHVLGPTTLLRRLAQRFEVLTSTSRGATARQQTLRRAIDWSWDLLEPWEQLVLRQCAVFCGGFSVEAAEAVLDASALEGHRPFDGLQSLRDKSLLRMTELSDDGELRMGMYESIREYAAQKLEEAGEAEATRARHADYFLRVGTAWAGDAGTDRWRASRKRLTTELENVLAAHRHSVAVSPRDALRAALVLDAVLAQRGPMQLHLAILDASLAAAADAELPREWSAVQVRRGRARLMAGAWDEARADLDGALAAARENGDPFVEALALMYQGFLTSANGGDDGAASLELARLLLRKAKRRRWEGVALGNLGIVHLRAGRLDRATESLAGSAAIARAVGDELSVAAADLNLAIIAQERGRLDEARSRLERAIAIHERNDERYGCGYERLHLGTVMHEIGDLDSAERLYRRAVVDLGTLGARAGRAVALGALGALLARCDCVDEARDALDDAEAELEAVGATADANAVRVHRGHLDLAFRRACVAEAPTLGAQHTADAELRMENGKKLAHTSEQVRFALRVLARALDRTSDPSHDAALVVSASAAWFRAPTKWRVDLGARVHLRGLLRALVEARLERPGTPLSRHVLLQAGWPGERILPRAGANRLYVAIAALRELGLRDIIQCPGAGYLIAAHISVLIERESFPLPCAGASET